MGEALRKSDDRKKRRVIAGIVRELKECDLGFCQLLRNNIEREFDEGVIRNDLAYLYDEAAKPGRLHDYVEMLILTGLSRGAAIRQAAGVE